MANEIKNLHLIAPLLSESDITKIETGALQYRRHASIHFKVESLTENELTVKVFQEKNFIGKYLDKNELIDRARSLFGKFFPEHKITVHATPYAEPEVNVVTPEWIQAHMKERGVKLKAIARDTGIDYTQLSAVTTGKKPLSQPVKAMFYYYFARA